jgi:superfamily I DNA and/or RNA helicase
MIHIEGRVADKSCPKEGEVVLQFLRLVAQHREPVRPDLYLITPFVVVQDRLRQLVCKSGVLSGWVEDPWFWALHRIGTVHTVQGRKAEAVVIVPGAPNLEHAGAREWAGRRPNLLNMAVTRAKEALYVVGNRQLWRGQGCFGA